MYMSIYMSIYMGLFILKNVKFAIKFFRSKHWIHFMQSTRTIVETTRLCIGMHFVYTTLKSVRDNYESSISKSMKVITDQIKEQNCSTRQSKT